MTTQMLIRLVLGMGMTAVVGVFALHRVWWLFKMIMSGQPASGRTDDLGARIGTEIGEVFGQRRMLRWSVPGLAHFFTMWGFFILLTVYIEAYGVVFQPNFHIPIIGRWDVLGFLQDFFALAVLTGITTFAIIRLRTEPKEYGRRSRFYGSHLGAAWLALFMIFNVIWTYALFRGASVNTGNFPYGRGAFFSHAMGALLHPLGHTGNEILETVALMLHIGVMLGFLILVSALQASAHLPGADQCAVQAAAGRAGPAAADRVRRQAGRLRGPARGRGLRARQDRGLHLEGDAGLRHLHRVRALPVPVPGVEHRQAAVAQARHHGPARPLDGQGALSPGREDRGAARGPRPRNSPRGGPSRPRVRLRPRSRARARASRPPAGRHRRAGRRHRPRRAVVVRDLRGLRRTVPGGYRARRPHRGHAPLPGDDGVGVPLRAVGAVQEPGNQEQPVGAERLRPDQLDRRGGLRRPRLRRRRRQLRRLRVPVLGGLRGRLRRQGQENHQGRRRTARHRRGEVPGAGHRGDLQRRLRAPLGQRVPVPAAGRSRPSRPWTGCSRASRPSTARSS